MLWMFYRLFQSVLIPQEVCSELRHRNAPAEVQRWISAPPSWLEVRSIEATATAAIPDLDAGEEAAIRLAEQLGRWTMRKPAGRQPDEGSQARERWAFCRRDPRM